MSFDTLNDALKLVTGLDGKWIKGKVITNVDPKNLDRIQVDAPGVYDSNLGQVPWIGPLKLSPFGFGSGYGTFGTPDVGSDVAILLQNGDAHYPLYMHIQCFPNPGDFQSGQAWGFEDPRGNKLVVKTDKNIAFTSGGGFEIQIDPSGNFTVTTPGGGSGTFNVDNLTFNGQNYTINANAINTNGHLTQTGQVDITGNTTVTGPFNVLSGVASFASMVTFLSGIDIIGPATANGHNIGETHTHFNQSGVHTGIVYT